MVKIVRPEEQGSLGTAQISPGVAASAGSGQVELGRTISSVGKAFQQTEVDEISANLGNFISNQGKEYFEKSKVAHQTGLLANKMSEATIEFMKAKEGRYKQVTDKNGNPMFTTLVDDVGKLGDDIIKRVGDNIIDPEVRAKFKAQFTGYLANQKISAFKHAQAQQKQFAIQSIENRLDSLTKQGVADDINNIGDYEAQAQDILNKAALSGIITTKTRDAEIKRFSDDLRTNAIRNMIQNNPEQANAFFATNQPSGLGQEADAQFKNEHEIKTKTDKRLIEESKLLADIDNKSALNILVSDIEDKIEGGMLRDDDLLRLKPILPEKTYKALVGKQIAAVTDRANERRRLSSLNVAILNDDGTGAYSEKDINASYGLMVEKAEAETGAPVSLSGKAMLAAAHKRDVSAFRKELEASIKLGDVKNAGEILQSYTYLQDKNSEIIHNLDSETLEIIELAKINLRSGSVSPEGALSQARESYNAVDATVRDFRKRNYNNRVKDFTGNDGLEAKILDAFDEKFFGQTEVSDETLARFEASFKAAYERTGDMESAFNASVEKFKQTHKVSKVSNTGQVDFLPPEKLYPEFKDTELREILEAEVKQVEPNLAPEKISLGSRPVGGRYPVMKEIETSEGEVAIVPVTNEDGIALTWSPEGSNVLIEKALKQKNIVDQEVVEAVQQNLERRSEEAAAEKPRTITSERKKELLQEARRRAQKENFRRPDVIFKELLEGELNAVN